LQTKYSIHIITNGFQDVQSTKIEFSGISSYINTLITSFDAKSKKPDPEIFNYALAITGAKSEESVIIGDDYETDIEGGYNYGISVIFYNLKNKPNPLKVPEVSHLDQLRNLL
jgi:putative hydrolase of the HAD superfamily